MQRNTSPYESALSHSKHHIILFIFLIFLQTVHSSISKILSSEYLSLHTLFITKLCLVTLLQLKNLQDRNRLAPICKPVSQCKPVCKRVGLFANLSIYEIFHKLLLQLRWSMLQPSFLSAHLIHHVYRQRIRGSCL